MALSQCLDDSPALRPYKRGNDINIQELYNERHRLALEELVAGGVDAFLGFLKKERIPNFLSDDEIRRITHSAVVPRCVSLNGEDIVLEHSMTSSMDCSSVTYFPEVSDVEPPLLEMGWPAFTAGSFRGVTRAVAHFQPSYGESIYSCKEAARRMIKSAKEVIAVVTDSLTDLDIFRDLQEACCRRRVPVYILLDQSCVGSFLQMCRNLSVRLEDLRQMRVRTITGATYFLRSGAKITGKVHERFMLIDGNRVATGSYRFNWTDGKLNSSNLIELSGQITENFDEEFRILYAQSLPISTRAPGSARNSGIYDHLLLKPPAVPQSPRVPVPVPQPEPARMTSTPTRAQVPAELPPGDEAEVPKSSPVSDSSTLGEDWMEQDHVQDVLAEAPTGVPVPGPVADAPAPPLAPPSCHTSTQTSFPTTDSGVQTDPEACFDCRPLSAATTTNQTVSQDHASSGSGSDARLRLPPRVDGRPPLRHPPDGNLRDCFRKLTKERQYHYSTIRTKLDHMVALLSHRRELVDLTKLALSPRLHRACKFRQDQGSNPTALMESVLTAQWSRSRCLQ
ncbi:hypothetical protein MATL_G00074720 [Megalops atlanticus]|uniref:Scaffolding anchor of CK1 domain-containing protein n=1 Tax=Megalops atlanticus TaxID=7932 RepID=A0A9D3Q8H8_MEGAT|nr:hypothetical protein MATL_G00074720 [Megalops atlanticus]